MSTHNTREGIEEVTHKVLANMELVLMKKLDGSDIAEIWEILKPTIEHIVHQELQKARHDWLREEIVKLEGMLSRWVAAYMPADEGKDPSKWGFKTEKEAWDFIEKRLTPCPLDPRDKSGEPCDSCIAEWMVYQIPEVDQALQTIIDRYQSELDQDTELLNSVKEDWDKQAKNAMNGLDQDVSK